MRVRGLPEAAALVVVLAIISTWVDVASESSRISGTDAAHYHVPVAINLSLGASPFDLPATPHPYPMAAGVLHAWFMVPTGALLADLAMCLPFLLLLAALNWIFRLATGLSGLGWASWPGVLLFSTPLFRSSSLISADLWFAAAFAALGAVLLSIVARQSSPRRAIVLGSLAFGLLVGSKTLGSLAGVLLIGVFVLIELVRLFIVPERPRWPMARALAAAALAATLVFGAGGVWLIRNWHLYGSPVAPAGVTLFGVEIFPGEPVAPTTHLSVFGDLQNDDAYDLKARTIYYIRSWIGSWFVPTVWLSVLVPVDVAVTWARRRDLRTVAARALIWLMTAGVGGVLVWLLVGAPWTSLEWTDGMSLRYVLPVLALLPLVGVIALLPASWRWYERTEAASVVQGALIAVSLSAFYAALDPETPRPIHVPPLDLEWVGAALVIVVTLQAASVYRDGVLQMPVLLLVALVLAGTWTRMIDRRAEDDVRSLEMQQAQELFRFTRSTRTGNDARDAYYVALAEEGRAGRQCASRRFFVLTRFDEPLMVQSPRFTSQVFQASRDIASTAQAGPLGACDYVITTRPVMDTDKGQALTDALAGGSPVVEIGEAGPFVILGRR